MIEEYDTTKYAYLYALILVPFWGLSFSTRTNACVKSLRQHQ